MTSLLSTVSPSALAIVIDFSQLAEADQQTILSIMAKRRPLVSAAEAVPAPGMPLTGLPASFSLTEGQGRALLNAVDPQTNALLHKIADLYDPATGKGHISWPEIREVLFGIPPDAGRDAGAWTKFTKGHRSGLHRSLRHITKDPKAEMLIAVGDTSYFIDAPALLVFRSLFGLN